uniref:Polyprotein n=1 Tax=Rehmannia torradovirus TaxID=3078460 RepID=A0AA96KRJ4_9SECO|nr:polyprotein [Rehmannia torradovirus]
MVSFSSLRSTISGARCLVANLANPDISRLVCRANEAVEEVAGAANTLNRSTLPLAEEATASFAQTCATVNTLLRQVSNILSPLFRTYDFIVKTWNVIVDIVVNSLASTFSAMSHFLKDLYEASSVVLDGVIIVALICVVALVLLLLFLRDKMADALRSVWYGALAALSAFASSFPSASWLSAWIMSLASIPAQEAQVLVQDGHAKPSVDSSTVGTMAAFAISSLTVFFFSKQGLVPRSDRNPLLQALKSSGDFAAKSNQLFAFFRNVKTECGTVFSWIIDSISDLLEVQSPTLRTLNAYLQKDDLFQWIRDVDAATDPEGRLERFAEATYISKLKDLKERGEDVLAICAIHPVVSFLAQRVHATAAKLDKELEAAVSHKGVGVQRAEPFMVQWYGEPGVGKTMAMNLFCHDLLDLCEEPRANRVYCVPRGDAFWSGYAHQTAVFLDDLGQILDSAGQCPDVKTIISIKSSHPVGLPMADLKEKGTHFTSKYIFATSNSPTGPPDCGIITAEAFDRRRNILFHVYAVGPIDFSKPTEHLRFSVCNRFDPYWAIPELSDLTYLEALRYTYNLSQQHFLNGRCIPANQGTLTDVQAVKEEFSQQAQGGILGDIFALPTGASSVATDNKTNECGRGSFPHTPEQFAEGILVSSCKYAFHGSLANEDFLCSDNANAKFRSLDAKQQSEIVQWKNTLLYEPIKEEEVLFWQGEIHDDWKQVCRCRMDMLSFDNISLVQKIGTRKNFSDCFKIQEDLRGEMEFMPSRTRFAFLLLARYYQSNPVRRDPDVGLEWEETSWCKKIFQLIVSGVSSLPRWARIVIKLGIVCLVFYGLRTALSTALGIPLALANLCCDGKMDREAQPSNESNDPRTRKGSKKGRDAFLTSQALVPLLPTFSWDAWVDKDPFFQQSMPKNLAMIKIGGAVFRGLFVNTDWIVTVKHAFIFLPAGTPFTLVSQHAQHTLLVNKSESMYRELPDTDVVFINVMGCDGCKRDIRNHFIQKRQAIISQNTPACFVKPVFSDGEGVVAGNIKPIHCKTRVTSKEVTRMAYSMGKFTIEAAHAISLDNNGDNGDCGSILFIPNAVNGQPEIVGIHVAGYDQQKQKSGYRGTTAALIFREDLSVLDTPLQAAQIDVQLPIVSRYQLPYDAKQVFYLGNVPRELAANIPRATALKPSIIHQTLTEVMGPCDTEPSILVSTDSRCQGKDFDPYLAGVLKFNETAHSFDLSVAEEAFEYMKRRLLSALAAIPVPGERPQVRCEKVALNGIDGEEYYDPMDLSTSCGWPFNLGERGKNKRGHVVEVDGYTMLDRTSEAYAAYIELQAQLLRGEVPTLVTSECAKDERLPKEKIYEKPKTRLFTILPFHYNMLVRQYFLDFSASMMRAHNKIPCKVGIAFDGPEWSLLANQFLEVNDKGFSADYSSFDGRAPVFIFQWFCDLVSAYYGDAPGSEDAKVRNALLYMASSHLTLCGERLFSVKGGMPSGFSLTVIFNSLLNEFYMRYAFGMLLKRPDIRARAQGVTAADFDSIFLAVYGDDNLVAVPLNLSWYTLPRIAEELAQVNVVIKSGLDKGADVALIQTSPLDELVFLSRQFKKHPTGFFLAPLKWVSVKECLYWVRAKGQSEVEALMENVETAMREAFYHGRVVFGGLEKLLQETFAAHSLPMPSYPSFTTCEMIWIEKVTGSVLGVQHLPNLDLEELDDVNKLDAGSWGHNFNEIFPNILTCSIRHLIKNPQPENVIIVNCSMSKKVGGIRGPCDWKDLENKVWAFTMAAIEETQIHMVARRQPCSGLVFVSQDGEGIAVVVAALAAMASQKYTTASILKRVSQITGVNRLMQYGAGTGGYLLTAAGCALYAAQSHPVLPGLQCYSPLDVLMKVGGCYLLAGTNIHEVNTESIAYWITPTKGFAGLTTSLASVRGDPFGDQLAAAITAASEAGGNVYMFFRNMTPLHAAWILEANRKCGIEVKGLDAVTISRVLQEEPNQRLHTIPAFGLGVVRNSGCFSQTFLACDRAVAYLTDREEEFLFSPPEAVQELCSKAPKLFRCKTLLFHLKVLVATRKNLSFASLRNLVAEHVGAEGNLRFLLILATLCGWCGKEMSVETALSLSSPLYFKQILPEVLVVEAPESVEEITLPPNSHGGEYFVPVVTAIRKWGHIKVSPHCSFLFLLLLHNKTAGLCHSFGESRPIPLIGFHAVETLLDLALDMSTHVNISS